VLWFFKELLILGGALRELAALALGSTSKVANLTDSVLRNEALEKVASTWAWFK